MTPTRQQVRLLAGLHDGPSYAAHRARHGALQLPSGSALLDEIEAAGLLGRGGAGFPTGRKMRTVAAGRKAVVVGNGCEGEPGSGKDEVLLTRVPHLVLDGLQAAAHAVRGTEIHLAVHRGSPAVPVLRAALAERRDRVAAQLAEVPGRYVSSEETSLVHFLNGGEAKPTFTPPRPFESGVRRRPTLINNVETLAQVGLIARYGAAWFREVGDPDEPGTQLLTVSGPTGEGWQRRVVEVPSGTTVSEVFTAAGLDLQHCQAVLVGGYFGAWLPVAVASHLPMTHREMRTRGGALGAGIVIGLPKTSCGILETARVAAYLAAESAGQCGPCLNGLPLIAKAVGALATGPWDNRTMSHLDRWLTVVPGRGACRHPDGAVRFVVSALSTFDADVQAHRSGRPCRAVHATPVLPVPRPGGPGGWS
ncbi:MAG: NADH-ubiquinone oxidoreductase-F iron-sulfur binding region domain-containing protein [Mycobacteriales bacterium]